MIHCLFNLTDKLDDKMAKYSFCFCCLKSTKSIPHYSYNVFSCGFQKSIHSCLIFFEFYGDLHSTMTMMMKLFQTTSPFNYELHTMIDNTFFLLLNYVLQSQILLFYIFIWEHLFDWSTQESKEQLIANINWNDSSFFTSSLQSLLDDASFSCFSSYFYQLLDVNMPLQLANCNWPSCHPAECRWHSR